ncbi:MAG TPA: SIS domain-containing protein [Acidimicrobiales bacterium]|jgi:glucosamine--fructose-6-phosphate aminotransferase (isomerizing)|nr:SIS domain-containing protein [Acidimicrobiales bacterium]
MCGIIAVVRRTPTRSTPASAEILDRLRPIATELERASDDGLLDALAHAVDQADTANSLLLGVPGLRVLLDDPGLAASIVQHATAISIAIADIEQRLDRPAVITATDLERLNATLVRLKDAVWAIERDRLRTARAVSDLAGPGVSGAGLGVYLSIQQALSALDRLEVRGRDSAGLHVLVFSPGFVGDTDTIKAELAARSHDHLFRNLSVRQGAGYLSFVYKAAAEIGELGDNTRALRDAIRSDELLRRALAPESATAVVLGHTRWASVGIVSEPNAHPLNGEQIGCEPGPYSIAALNGDVDNFADLIVTEGLCIAPEITTDAKIIPTLMSKHLQTESRTAEAFRRTVSVFEGSVAIAAATALAPQRLQLALRGSGQALYVGLADDTFIVASEPYGVVEETATYLRLDGETPGNPENTNASRGQIVELDGQLAGTLAGICRVAYDGTELPVRAEELATAQITTRDIDRGDAPHFLLKEISEAPASFRKTLRGKLVERDGVLEVLLGSETLPSSLRTALSEGQIRTILCIGQGTAAVAAESVAASIRDEVQGLPVRVEARLATELSGFGIRSDMSDTLVIAVSQSGTTTDTNRTVDVVRARGATVIAIVNRRNSDLTDKADGVLYTSDGRDVEMSVASTKAFYSQIAAGFLLAIAIADLFRVGVANADPARQALLRSLRDMPDAMNATLERRPTIADAARRHAPSRRYWAVVGNGANYIAAKELRIKLSELCYKSIAHDSTEDKKHIDLSSEPMILVCAAGLVGSNADDVAKEVAIYRAHKAAPVVIANEGETRFSAALDAITVPAVHPRLAFVLSTMVGHVFGYEAARAIDAQARPLREIRSAIEQLSAAAGTESGEVLLARLRPVLERNSLLFYDGLRTGAYNGHLEASSAVRVAALLRYALQQVPLESYQSEFGKIGTPSVVIDDLVAALTVAIEELTRPIDAIKHQAKTVTVGISRSDETLLQAPLPRAVIEIGTPRDRLSYRTLRTLADLDPAVAEVRGYIRYRVEGLDAGDGGTGIAVVVDRGGISRSFPSRTDRDPTLRGSKHKVATERLLYIAKGYDGRSIVLVPEVKDNQTTGITLLHVKFHDRLPAAVMRGVLQGYRERYGAIRDMVTETEPTFREDLLGVLDVFELLTLPVVDLAKRWRSDAPAA